MKKIMIVASVTRPGKQEGSRQSCCVPTFYVEASDVQEAANQGEKVIDPHQTALLVSISAFQLEDFQYAHLLVERDTPEATTRRRWST